MRTGVPAYIKWRVLDFNGNVIVDPLPHPHQSRFQVWGCQQGTPGAAALGTFTIPLFSPDTDRYKWAKADYDLLAYGQRVEAYLTAAPEESAGAWGTPKFSGVILQTQRDLGAFAIAGDDSMWWAQKSLTGRTDLFADTTDNLLRYGFKAYKAVYTDGDQTATTPWTSGNYTNDGTWTFNIADDQFKTAKAGTTGDGLLYTASYGNTNYADMYVEASYHLHCDTAANALAEAGVVAALADTSNFILGRAMLKQVTATSWIVTAEIYQKSAGTYTLKSAQTVFPVNTADRVLQVRLIGLQLSSTLYQWRLLVNGTDSGCFWIQTVGAGSPTGSIGLRSNKAGSAANENAWATQLVFANKSRIFQDGSISVGATTVTEVLQSMPLLDLWNMAATVENNLWRKNPKVATAASPFPDTVDYASSPGTDRSGSIFFTEGQNLEAVTVSPNAEGFATGLTVQGSGSMDGSGQFTYYNLGKIATAGLIMDSVAAPGYSDNVTLRQFAARILAFRSAPSASITGRVVRDSDTADVWREQDTVTLIVPRHYLNRSAQRIIGYDLQEGVPSQQVTFTQYPAGHQSTEARMHAILFDVMRKRNEVQQFPI